MKLNLLDSTKSFRLTILLVGILSVAGTALVLYITAIGPWAYSDSAAYITTARNIAAGRGIVLQDTKGIFSLLPLHAPLFPLAISLPITFGADAVQASRWLNAILFGLTTLLVGGATLRFTHSFWLTIGTICLYAIAIEPLVAFSGAMAEGLFLFWGFLSLFLVAHGVQRKGNNLFLLAGAGVSAGLAILARYTGLAMLGTGLIAILIFSSGNLRKRVKNCLVFVVPGSILACLWFIPVYLSTGTFASRQVGNLEGIGPKFNAYLEAFFQLAGGWLPFLNRGNHILPPWLKLVIGLSLMIGLIIFVTIKFIAKEKSFFVDRVGWGFILIVYSISYTALHLSAYVSAEIQPDINGRLLVPIYIAGVLVAPIFVSYISRVLAPREWIVNLGFVALVSITIWYFHSPVNEFIFEMHNFGVGYTSKRWNENPIFQEIEKLKPEMPLASNSSALVLFYTERFPVSVTPNADRTGYDLSALTGSGLILFSDSGKSDLGESYFPFVDAVIQQTKVVFDNNEGIVLLPK